MEDEDQHQSCPLAPTFRHGICAASFIHVNIHTHTHVSHIHTRGQKEERDKGREREEGGGGVSIWTATDEDVVSPKFPTLDLIL